MLNLNSLPKPDFRIAWLIIAAMMMMQVVYIVICHVLGSQIQQPLPEDQRLILRSVLYAVAIISFPLTNLIRHIQLRLNQTMPGDKSAHKRYLSTVIVSQAFVESIGVFGLVMFILGDDFNTLYIFSGLAALGFFLYRPKAEEYYRVAEALNRH